MKRILAASLMLCCSVASAQFGDDVGVKGRFRPNGRYVSPDYRNGSYQSYDNDWTYPHINPYPGQRGSRRYMGGFGVDYIGDRAKGDSVGKGANWPSQASSQQGPIVAATKAVQKK